MLVINEALINRYGRKDYISYRGNEDEKYGAIAALDIHLEKELIDYEIFLNDIYLCGRELNNEGIRNLSLEKMMKLIKNGYLEVNASAKDFVETDEDYILASEYPFGFMYCKGMDIIMELKSMDKINGYTNHLMPKFFG